MAVHGLCRPRLRLNRTTFRFRKKPNPGFPSLPGIGLGLRIAGPEMGPVGQGAPARHLFACPRGLLGHQKAMNARRSFHCPSWCLWSWQKERSGFAQVHRRTKNDSVQETRGVVASGCKGGPHDRHRPTPWKINYRAGHKVHVHMPVHLVASQMK